MVAMLVLCVFGASSGGLVEVRIKLPCSSKQPTEPIPRCAVLLVDRKGQRVAFQGSCFYGKVYSRVPTPLKVDQQ
jgi:hypothetical protein